MIRLEQYTTFEFLTNTEQSCDLILDFRGDYNIVIIDEMAIHIGPRVGQLLIRDTTNQVSFEREVRTQ
jgi:hypothetical protein